MDEKILEILTQMQADIYTRLSGVESELRNINQRLTNVESDLASVKDEISSIKEDTEITRTAVNTLVEWVDQASDVLDIRYPVNH